MTPGHPQPRTYGGWRRSRGIGLLGLGPAATLALLAGTVTVLLAAAVSLHTLLYIAPPAALAAAGLVRIGGVPLAQLAIHRLRWWWATTGGHTSYRAEAVLRHTGALQLPGTLAATELLSAEDGSGRHYGIVRDRHTGFLTEFGGAGAQAVAEHPARGGAIRPISRLRWVAVHVHARGACAAHRA